MKFLKPAVVATALMAAASSAAVADDNHGFGPVRADSHAPIGVMAEHMHKEGEFMISYRFMRMDMEGSRDGTDELSPVEIATTVPNRFFGTPGQPPTLRVVPTEMTMDMHMFGAMYAPTDWVTLMAMGMYVDKEMDHITFQGPAGATVLGGFTTRSSGFGDTKLTGMFRLYDDGAHHLHFNAGLSLPTGSITETDQVLAPTGATPTLRLPYAMQLGSGTVDLLPGLTYTGKSERFAWGAQASGVIRLGDNDEGYSLGDELHGTAWASFSPEPWVSFSGRLIGATKGEIDGIDPQIVAPVQTADPDNYGGETIEYAFGINLAGQDGWMRGHRLAGEIVLPAYRNLNGPQMETDWTLTLGYQYAF